MNIRHFMAAAFFAAGSLFVQADESVIIVNPLSAPAEIAAAETINDIFMAELSTRKGLKMIDREALNKVLKESALQESGMLDAGAVSSVGKILGADYFVSGSMRKAGENIIIFAKVIDVKTTAVKMKYITIPANSDMMSQSIILADFVGETVLTEKAAEKTEPAKNSFTLDPALPRPSVMIVIPEIHVGPQRIIDPAAENALTRAFINQNFKVVNFDRNQMPADRDGAANRNNNEITLSISGKSAVPAEKMTLVKYAKEKGADVVIYGEAIAEAGTRFGSFNGCRARVELKAIKTSDNSVFFAESAYAGASDLGEVVAGKKAIQLAAGKLAPELMTAAAKKFQK